MKQSRLDEWQEFLTFEKQRIDLKLSPRLQAMMDNCEYVIHSQFDKNNKNKNKHKKRYQQLTPQYRQAFKTLSRDEKMSYYIRYMKLIKGYLNGKIQPPLIFKGMFSSDVYSRSFNLKMWKYKRMRLDRQKHILFAQKDDKIKTYILQDYIMRKSKNKQYYSFVLQAINNKPHQKSRTVHLGFREQVKFIQWYKQLNIAYNYIQWKLVSTEMSKGGRAMTQSDNLGKSFVLNSQRSYSKEILSQSENQLSKSVLVESSRKNQVIFRQNESLNSSISTIQKKQKVTQKQQIFFSGSSEQQIQTNPVLKNRQTIIQQIAKIDDIQQIQAITQRERIKQSNNQLKQDIFHRLLPQYNLMQLQNTMNYGNLYQQNNLRIFGHLKQPLKVKAFIMMGEQYNQKLILNSLTQTETLKQINSQIQQFSLKTMIKSQNSAMIYLKIKAYNKLYRPRDFIFLRHVFRVNQIIYIVDKSIQSVSYPPFTTIVRGQLVGLWSIKNQSGKTSITADINMNNQGYLNDSQNVNLILKYLKSFSNIEKVIKKKQFHLQQLALFHDKWNIVQEANNQVKIQSKTAIQKKSDKKINQQLQFKKKKTDTEKKQLINNLQLRENASIDSSPKKSEQKTESKKQVQVVSQQKRIQKALEIEKQLKKKYSNMEEQRGEIGLQQAQMMQNIKNMTVHGIKRQFDQKGMVVVSNNFVKTKYILNPLPKKQIVFQEAIQGHPIWKGQWIHDDKVGGIIFVNQKKIEDQKGVLKFILTKIGKNLLSGKSVLNISLPVDIFCAESNLQRLIYSLTYAPTHLQPAVKQKSSIERLKKIIAFGISNSPLYLNMQKPFNPILGETFQCWIDGCPVYAEQISHHPPIAALLYQGRGFRMVAQLQSKVQLHMNSGCGTNQGVFKIKFEDGMQGCYITPGGQVSGLTYGDRKFNMVGKSYYWIQSENLFLQLVFNPTKKGFFSVGKQQQPVDYFEGVVCRVKSEFWQSFNKKRRAPLQKQIQEKFGRVNGIWNKFTQYDEQIILNVQKQFPAKLQYQANPLPSDANWREDIAYRRILQTTKSQSEKQRLQILQRKDRKLREANPNYQNHHKK